MEHLLPFYRRKEAVLKILSVIYRFATFVIIFCRLFKNILTTMATDWTHSSTGKLDTNAMISKADLSNRCSKLIMCVYTIAVFFYTSVFVEIIREIDNTEFDMKSREFLIKMEFPFVSYNSSMYKCILLVQFFQLMAIASAIGMLDALIITLVSIGTKLKM